MIMETVPASSAKLWYAVEIYNKREGKLSALLESRGIHPFAPTRMEQKTRGKKLVVKEVPLVPGYFFVCCTRQEFDALRRERPWGMISIRGPVPDEEIRRFQTKPQKEEKPREVSLSVFSQGMEVCIVRGSFANLKGIFSHGQDGKAVVKVSIFGRETPAELDVSDIEAV